MKNTNEGLLTRIRNVVSKDGGFTLIEVLAVMVIVGLLAAIAIPQISKWRQKAHVTALKTDARTISQAVEAFYVDNGAYPNTVTISGTTATLTQTTPAVTDTVTVNSGTTFSTAYQRAADGESFTFALTSTKAGKVVSYNSATGGLS